LWVRIPPGAWMFVCCECCVLSGRGLCDVLILHPGESYRVCMCVCVSTCVTRCNPNPLHLHRVGRRDTNKNGNIFIAITHSKLVKIREKRRKWNSEVGGKCRPMCVYIQGLIMRYLWLRHLECPKCTEAHTGN
jgi:hypothetical protein